MEKNVFVMATALGNVRGRIGYVSSPNKQEHLEAYCSNMPKGGWKELSEFSQKQAALYHAGKGVCEGRELIVMLPNIFSRMDPNKLAQYLCKSFSSKYGVPCAVAIHWNKAENNFHAHVIFSERRIADNVRGRSIATRDTYFDAAGKRSTKQACVDEQGRLLDGCRLVKKGEALREGSRFGPKLNIFAQEEWMRQEKERIAAFYNRMQTKDRWKLYDWKKDPHFPMVRLVRGEPMALRAWKERENAFRKMYNAEIDKKLLIGEIDEKRAIEMKLEAMERRARERREYAEAKRYWIEHYEQQRARFDAEREYYRDLYRKGILGLTVELILLVCKVDPVKFWYGVDKADNVPVSKPGKVYKDEKTQAMFDAMRAVREYGVRTLDELGDVLKRKEQEVQAAQAAYEQAQADADFDMMVKAAAQLKAAQASYKKLAKTVELGATEEAAAAIDYEIYLSQDEEEPEQPAPRSDRDPVM